MKVFAVTSNPDLATVYMADMGDERMIEFVEACQPPYSRDERWILMVSTLFGCPVKCQMCDAGGHYRGKPTAEEILKQIDYMVDEWFPSRIIPSQKFKIQFARMGEPAFNLSVLEALETLPGRYDAPGLMPSISTIAPHGTDAFFEGLIDVKNRLYAKGRFQFQFSIHTTDMTLRDEMIPVRKWSFTEMAAYGERFHRDGDRKITLNFALADGNPADPNVLLRHFDPARYLIKITPVNPTSHAIQNGMASHVDPYQPETAERLAGRMIDAGYQTIVSIGEAEENKIGSNCGQYVLNYLESKQIVHDGYTYKVKSLEEEALSVGDD
jgi:23S rRNA (adenine2503-C2)-methyltransferase